MTDQKDRVYSKPLSTIDAFQFDATVADIFQDMIERSVPGYGFILQMIGSLPRHRRGQLQSYARSLQSQYGQGSFGCII